MIDWTRSVARAVGIGAFLLTAGAIADCKLTGSVTARGLPLGDVSVTLTRGGDEIAGTLTHADGTYEVRYPEFPAGLHAIRVTIQAPGHAKDERLLFRTSGRCLEATRNDVALELASDAPRDYSRLGLTLFVAPYTLYGDGADAIAARFNRDLRQIVFYRIVAYKSALGPATASVDISVNPLDEPLTAAEGELLRQIGQQLNALGVIAGDGTLVRNANGEQVLDLTSVFRTIPVYRDLELIMLPIEDQIPAQRVSPSKVAGSMRDLWGKQAILSYVLQRLVTHEGDWDQGELDRLRELLIEVRKTMTEGDPLLSPLQSLLRVVDPGGSS